MGSTGAAYASPVDADPVELRVLGCLLEKQRTTPDQYPLSLNALRLACNQATNRDPVVAYDEAEIHEALQRLARRGWTRLASGAGSRAAKYRQLFDEALGLAGDEVAVLCVLMLRGPQTPGELNQRTARLHAFAGLDEIHETLDRLAGRDLVARLDRRPGQKEERYRSSSRGRRRGAAGDTSPRRGRPSRTSRPGTARRRSSRRGLPPSKERSPGCVMPWPRSSPGRMPSRAIPSSTLPARHARRPRGWSRRRLPATRWRAAAPARTRLGVGRTRVARTARAGSAHAGGLSWVRRRRPGALPSAPRPRRHPRPGG